MNCQDDVRNEREEAKAKRLFDECATKCVQQFIPVVPEVVRVLSQKLDKVKKDANVPKS